MAAARPNVPPDVKRALIEEAGGKCANPGCPNGLTELHHIREWAAYQAHNPDHMIAICPTCHGHVTRGELRVSDETAYRWKSIRRPPTGAINDHLYVEPGIEAKLLLGSIAVTGDAGLVVFEFTERNRLSFAVKDGDIVALNLGIADRKGAELLRIVDGHVRTQAIDTIEYTHRPGHIRVTAPVQPLFLPRWALYRVQLAEAGFAMQERLTLLELEVIKPGLVRVQGIWTEDLRAVVITRQGFHHVSPHRELPITLMGAGEDSVLRYTGPINTALFGV